MNMLRGRGGRPKIRKIRISEHLRRTYFAKKNDEIEQLKIDMR